MLIILISLLHSYTRQKRGTVFASSDTKVLGKPEIRKWDTAPRIYVEAVLPSCLFSLAVENFLGFRIASLEHYASSAEVDFSHSAAKIQN
jgi:hypothetical protein